jgi:hypothetical protein
LFLFHIDEKKPKRKSKKRKVDSDNEEEDESEDEIMDDIVKLTSSGKIPLEALNDNVSKNIKMFVNF